MSRGWEARYLANLHLGGPYNKKGRGRLRTESDYAPRLDPEGPHGPELAQMLSELVIAERLWDRDDS